MRTDRHDATSTFRNYSNAHNNNNNNNNNNNKALKTLHVTKEVLNYSVHNSSAVTAFGRRVETCLSSMCLQHNVTSANRNSNQTGS
jgi:hypothetical protein